MGYLPQGSLASRLPSLPIGHSTTDSKLELQQGLLASHSTAAYSLDAANRTGCNRIVAAKSKPFGLGQLARPNPQPQGGVQLAPQGFEWGLPIHLQGAFEVGPALGHTGADRNFDNTEPNNPNMPTDRSLGKQLIVVVHSSKTNHRQVTRA